MVLVLHLKEILILLKFGLKNKIEDIKTYKFPSECDLKNKIILFRIHKTNIEKDNNKNN